MERSRDLPRGQNLRAIDDIARGGIIGEKDVAFPNIKWSCPVSVPVAYFVI